MSNGRIRTEARRDAFSGSNNWSWMSIGQTFPLRSMLLQFQLSRQCHSPFQIFHGREISEVAVVSSNFLQQAVNNNPAAMAKTPFSDPNMSGSRMKTMTDHSPPPKTGPNQHTVIFAQQSDDVDRITGRSHPSEDRSR